MSGKVQTTIRALLREHPAGLTVSALNEYLSDHSPSAIRGALRSMPDTYIDHWTEGRADWSAVWAVVVPPEHCPKPDHLPKRKHE